MKKYIFTVGCLLCAAMLLSGCDMAPVKAFGHTSSAVFYVSNSSETISDAEVSLSTRDLMVGQRLVQTYISICDSNKVLERVKETSGISDGFTMDAEIIEDSEMIEISVYSWDKQVAYDVCVAYTQVIPEVVSEVIVGSSVKIIELPKMPE